MKHLSYVAFFLFVPVGVAAAEPPKKALPLPGEVYALAGRTAFLILAPADPYAAAKP